MKNIYVNLLVIIISSGLLLVSGCKEKSSKVGANVLLITVDTLRADHLGCYNYFRNTSPNIDRLSSTGTSFLNAYCQMPTTAPSHASILTSTYPRRHGVLKNGWVLSSSDQTLTEILKKNGYATGAVVSSYVLDPRYGLSPGFDEYDADFEADGSSMGNDIIWEGIRVSGAFDQRADVATRKAIHWLEKNGKEKFFLWVHYFDPHTPYTPPSPYADEFLKGNPGVLEEHIAKYDGEIRFADEELGKLLQYLAAQGLDSRTLVVFMSDHGEGLGQHGWMEHGMYLYDEQTRIPLIFHLPGVVPGKLKIESVVESIDVAPTILDILGIEADARFSGRSLFTLLQNPDGLSGHPVFLERRDYKTKTELGVRVLGQKFAVRDGDYKYIWAQEEGTEELYNLVEDPGELMNRIDKEKNLSNRMKAMIQTWKTDQNTGQDNILQTIDPEALEKLKSLGYIE